MRRDIQQLTAVPFVPVDDFEGIFDGLMEAADERVMDLVGLNNILVYT